MSIAEGVICGDKLLDVAVSELDVDTLVVVLSEELEDEVVTPDVEHDVGLDVEPGCATSVFESVCELAGLVS